MLICRLAAVFFLPVFVAVSFDTSRTVYGQAAKSEGSKANADSRVELVKGSLKFRSVGPAFMSGRIGDVAIDPVAPNTWYVAVASGGLWKTTNAGTTFAPIFENKPSYSMGCVTIDPSTHTTIWLGTGENNGGRHIGFGDGVYAVSYTHLTLPTNREV